MRWYKPKMGDIRIKRKFAFFPVRIYNEVVWLETIRIKQKYCPVFGWECVEFIDKEK